MDDNFKIIFKKSITIFVAAYGAMWGLAESLVTFKAAPTFVESLGTFGYLVMGALALFFVVIYNLAKHYVWPDRIQVTICQFHRTVSYLPLYIAEHKGYFKKEGLTVKIIDGSGDTTTWDKVKSGEAQFGVADPLIMLEEPNIKGKVVSTILSRAAIWGMTRKSIAPIQDINDFSGKTVAVYKSPSTLYMMLQRILSENTLQHCVTIKEMMPGTEFSVMEISNVDIAFLPEPMATVAELNGAHRVFWATKYFGDFLITGLFATEKYLKEHPDVVQKVVNALERSFRFIWSNSTNALVVATKEFVDFPEFAIELGTLRLLTEKAIPKHATILMDSWSHCLQVRKPNDAASFPFSEYVDNSFALRAAAKYKKAND